MNKLVVALFTIFVFSAFTNPNNTHPELDGIWMHQEIEGNSKTYLVIDGDHVQLYMEAYWAAGYDQYFAGDKLIANGSLLIHVEDYLTISNNTGQAIKYRNCPKHKIQRVILHDINPNQVQIEIVPGTSIYDSFGFFQDKLMNFEKVEAEAFKKIDPIFHKIPSLLKSESTLIKDCGAGSN